MEKDYKIFVSHQCTDFLGIFSNKKPSYLAAVVDIDGEAFAEELEQLFAQLAALLAALVPPPPAAVQQHMPLVHIVRRGFVLRAGLRIRDPYPDSIG